MNIIRRNATSILHLVALAVLGILIYSNTLNSSFQFDDKINIIENPFIRDLGNLWPPSGRRWFGLLTFSVNYALGGLNPFGYHLVNICIHIVTAIAVYTFVLLTLRTPCFSDRQDPVVSGRWLAFACALLFAAHPIQTQAVTYIVQRFASLATMLFMLSCNFYILARLTTVTGDSTPSSVRSRPRFAAISLYALSALFGLLSLRTKENAYILPLMIVLYDLMFISSPSQLLATLRKRWQVVMGLAGLALALFIFINSRFGLLALFENLKATNEISRHDYLVTQFRVIATYIRLLFLPVNQTVDHHYPVFRSILNAEVAASLALIVLLLSAAAYLCILSRGRAPYLRLVSFGIFWFFITLSVESSFIPIVDVMFEHRLYLPAIGVILAVCAACLHALESMSRDRIKLQAAAAGLLVVLAVALSSATYSRNRVWQNELTLWSDVIAKKPDNPRGYNMVGGYYRTHFRIFDAITYFRKALEVDPSYAEARSNLGAAYLQIGRLDEGLNELLLTERTHRFDAIDTGILYYNIGRAYSLKGMPELAEQKLKLALRLIPDEAAVYELLGEMASRKNQPEQAADYFRKARELNPPPY